MAVMDQRDLFGQKAKENRQYEAMLKPAAARLIGRRPADICEKAGVRFDEETQEYVMETLGQEVRIHYPDFRVKPALEMWHHLTLLQYLSEADGAPLTGSWMSLCDMSGGMARGMSFNRHIATMFEHDFAGVDDARFARGCERLGGTIISSPADVCAVLYYAPRFPVAVSFWCSDDELPASGKALVDASAEHYLKVEAAGGVCGSVALRILKEIRACSAEEAEGTEGRV